MSGVTITLSKDGVIRKRNAATEPLQPLKPGGAPGARASRGGGRRRSESHAPAGVHGERRSSNAGTTGAGSGRRRSTSGHGEAGGGGGGGGGGARGRRRSGTGPALRTATGTGSGRVGGGSLGGSGTGSAEHLGVRKVEGTGSRSTEGAVSSTSSGMDAIEASILAADDAMQQYQNVLPREDVLNEWMMSYSKENSNFASVAIDCDLMMTRVVGITSAGGAKRDLITAVTFECYDKMCSVFGRYKSVMLRMRQELLMACYADKLPELAPTATGTKEGDDGDLPHLRVADYFNTTTHFARSQHVDAAEFEAAQALIRAGKYDDAIGMANASKHANKWNKTHASGITAKLQRDIANRDARIRELEAQVESSRELDSARVLHMMDKLPEEARTSFYNKLFGELNSVHKLEILSIVLNACSWGLAKEAIVPYICKQKNGSSITELVRASFVSGHLPEGTVAHVVGDSAEVALAALTGSTRNLLVEHLKEIIGYTESRLASTEADGTSAPQTSPKSTVQIAAETCDQEVQTRVVGGLNLKDLVREDVVMPQGSLTASGTHARRTIALGSNNYAGGAHRNRGQGVKGSGGEHAPHSGGEGSTGGHGHGGLAGPGGDEHEGDDPSGHGTGSGRLGVGSSVDGPGVRAGGHGGEIAGHEGTSLHGSGATGPDGSGPVVGRYLQAGIGGGSGDAVYDADGNVISGASGVAGHGIDDDVSQLQPPSSGFTISHVGGTKTAGPDSSGMSLEGDYDGRSPRQYGAKGMRGGSHGFGGSGAGLTTTSSGRVLTVMAEDVGEGAGHASSEVSDIDNVARAQIEALSTMQQVRLMTLLALNVGGNRVKQAAKMLLSCLPDDERADLVKGDLVVDETDGGGNLGSLLAAAADQVGEEAAALDLAADRKRAAATFLKDTWSRNSLKGYSRSKKGTKKQKMSMANVLALIADCYEKKMAADLIDDSRKQSRLPLSEFVKDYLIHRYGFPSLADSYLYGLVEAVKKSSKKSMRLRLFGLMVGVSGEDDFTCFRLVDVILNVLQHLFPKFSAAIPRRRREGQLFVPMDLCTKAIDAVFPKEHVPVSVSTIHLTEDRRDKLVHDVSLLAQNYGDVRDSSTTMKKGDSEDGMFEYSVVGDADKLMKLCSDAWIDQTRQNRDALDKLYKTYDADGSGTLSLPELSSLLLDGCGVAESELPPRRVMDIFKEMVQAMPTSDDCVDAAAFAQTCSRYGFVPRPEAIGSDDVRRKEDKATALSHARRMSEVAYGVDEDAASVAASEASEA